MAIYRVWSGATGANNGSSWANAFTTIAAALAVATSGSDIILVHKVYSDTATSLTGSASVSIICVDKDNGDAPATMGKTSWVFSDANVNTSLAIANRVYVYGLTFKVGGTSGRSQTIGADGCHFVLEQCLLWCANTNTAARIMLGGGGDRRAYINLRKTTLSFANASQHAVVGSKLELVDSDFDPAGVAPSVLFNFTTTDPGGMSLDAWGCDLSSTGSSSLVGDSGTSAAIARFWACKLGTGFTALDTQSAGNRAGAEVYLHDCATGDTHGLFGYYNALGSVVSDTGIYLAAGAAGQSWKITTTSNASPAAPFQTPWIDTYVAAGGSVTPYIEILRDGSVTPYTDAEVWMDAMAKTTSGSVLASIYEDRQALADRVAGTAGSAQAAGAGLGAWTGEGGTAWSGKCGSGAAISPAEAGYLRGRISVAAPSSVVYVDPQIRT